MSCFILYSLSVDKEGGWALSTPLPAGKISPEDRAMKAVAIFNLSVPLTSSCEDAAPHTRIMLACSALGRISRYLVLSPF